MRTRSRWLKALADANLPFWNPANNFENRSEQEILRQIRHYDLDGYSDLELRRTLLFQQQQYPNIEPAALLPQVFAIVNASISRRLGAWRLFDTAFDRGNLERYYQLAGEILRSSDYAVRAGQFAGQHDGQSNGEEAWSSETFGQLITPLLVKFGLDSDELAVVNSIIYVEFSSQGRSRWDIFLPVEFYQALARLDNENRLGFHPTDEQIWAGVLLHRGNVVEMNAGEGKTIAAAFPATLHAVLGNSVHLMTANDYLAARDSELLAPVYRSLGLSVDAVLGHMIDEERKDAYQKQIVYGTMREFGFDFLRDNLKLSPHERVQGPLEMAIVDEADHALIDEGRTPMIIAGEPVSTQRGPTRVKQAITRIISLQEDVTRRLVEQLYPLEPGSKASHILLATLLLAQPDHDTLRRQFSEYPGSFQRIQSIVYPDGSDYPDDSLTGELFFVVDPDKRFVTVTERGQNFLEAQLGAFFDTRALEEDLAAANLNVTISLARRRKLASSLTRRLSIKYNFSRRVYQMLRAYLLFQKDVDYQVVDNSIILIDRYTGRSRPDSRYQAGLQEALEAKESVTINPEREVLAQISVHGFASQYSSLAGLTGTAQTASISFKQIYSLEVVNIPPTRPLLRQDLGCRVYTTDQDKLDAISEEVKFWHQVGRPVLVGTQTVEQSKELSRRLIEYDVPHNLLNAVTGHDEAQIVRDAGTFGAVTVATTMAGRGTDIIIPSDLNLHITDKYLSLIEGLRSQGIGEVTIKCYTKEEADCLGAKLDENNKWTISRKRVEEHEELTLARPRAATPTGAEIHSAGSLEFGLGLYVISTEFNQSPRIDLQLKGRSGRQGEFGWSRTILSLKDRPLAFQKDSSIWSARAESRDPAGRVYFEGREVDRYLKQLQSNADRDDQAQRGWSQDYENVMDSQTHSYYELRQQAMESDSLLERFGRLAEQQAGRVVNQHFPMLQLDDYSFRFGQMSEEIQQDYGIDPSSLKGLGLDLLQPEIARLLSDQLQYLKERSGENQLAKLAKLLLLETSDKLWRDHIAKLGDMTIGAQLFNHGHKVAVADYVTSSYDAWQFFQRQVVEQFLSGLLTFPIDQLIDLSERPETPVDLPEDVALILV